MTLFPVISRAQESKKKCIPITDTLTGQTVYQFPDKFPVPERGMQDLLRHFKYPASVPDSVKIQSKILVAFIVDENGNITGKRVLKNIAGTEFATDLLNSIEKLKWIPGTCGGDVVPTIVIFPLTICFRN